MPSVLNQFDYDSKYLEYFEEPSAPVQTYQNAMQPPKDC